MNGSILKKLDILDRPEVYAAWHPNDTVRMSSSSGGAFSLLAETVIKHGGVVFGALWNKDNDVVIGAADNMENLAKLRESKYVAAIPGNEYAVAKAYLDQGREVLYSGTPCQVAGLYSYLGNKRYSGLTTVDFICHGTPDRRAWRKYVAYIERTCGNAIKGVRFRDKRWGVEGNLLLCFILGNGVVKLIYGKDNTYYHGFVHDIILRRCCFSCKFNQMPRGADLSLADYRGLGEHLPFAHETDKVKGFSALLVNSKHGKEFLSDLEYKSLVRRPLEEILSSQPFLVSAHRSPPETYDSFWKDFETNDWDLLAKKYLKPSLKYRFYINCRRILGPRLFLVLGIVYKKMRGLRTTSWLPVRGAGEFVRDDM